MDRLIATVPQPKRDPPGSRGSAENSGAATVPNAEQGRTLASAEAARELRFQDQYELRRRLSKGSFGVVYVARRLDSGGEFAVKVIEREKLSDKEKHAVEREVSILKDCRDVENVVRLVDFFASPQTFYVVQEYMEGGDVFERLARRTSYSEKDARDLAERLLQAIEVLHSRKLAHRDLKPENLLLKDILDDTEIVLADFGFASYVPPEGLKTRCGTPAFVAPEVLVPNCRYDERVDMWSVGCLLYMLIGGYPPFQDRSHRGLFHKVRGGDYVFHDQYWKNVSLSAKQLISSLLTVDPKYRATARMALCCNWLKMDDELLRSHDLSVSLGEIKKFHAKRTLKGAMHAVNACVNKFGKFRSANDAMFKEQLKDWDDEEVSETQDTTDRSDSMPISRLRAALDFHDVYEKGRELHSGTASKIYECYPRQSRQEFAVKIVDRKETSRKSVTGKTTAESVLHEVAILDSLKHRNIIQIIDFFEDDDHFYLVMERMRGGDVFDRITQKKKYTEKDARDLAKVLLDTVAYLHENNIAHRDLKPQCLLLKSKKNDADIKISDFSFACRVHTPQSLTTRCGTPTYVAPEVLKNIPYDQSADMWSIGVILYVLLCGYPPFVDEIQSELFRKVRTAEWQFSGPEWEQVSEDAKNLIRRLLVANPKQRLTAKQALTCKWFCDDEKSLETHELLQSKETLKKRKSRLRSVAKALMFSNGKSDQKLGLSATETLLKRPEESEEERKSKSASRTLHKITRLEI